ncbi:hypothetical protein BDV38DRAFT_245835 [Aspergillus pseudotamarii]|uniref:Uncharacterized protein n=1 Tax=Aspergillus pseudotamarii TaxID=132259 RepID=A0A5N6ST90_ASPPS|nr:uncharacterized protein BDV38DRAFT_245835 [Aspergillus pseudotamarii]KAE8137906.1 hypothetical protein BDV38DRAFT_245835 [Aspergillus pseudotamarii]
MDLLKRLWNAPRRSEWSFASQSPLMCLLWGPFLIKSSRGIGPHGRNEYERHDRLGFKRAPSVPLNHPGAGQNGY